MTRERKGEDKDQRQKFTKTHKNTQHLTIPYRDVIEVAPRL